MARKTKKEKIISELRRKVQKTRTTIPSETISYNFSTKQPKITPSVQVPMIETQALYHDLRKTIMIAAILFAIEYMLYLFFERNGYEVVQRMI